jgi:hypothetical protein
MNWRKFGSKPAAMGDGNQAVRGVPALGQGRTGRKRPARPAGRDGHSWPLAALTPAIYG